MTFGRRRRWPFLVFVAVVLTACSSSGKPRSGPSPTVITSPRSSAPSTPAASTHSNDPLDCDTYPATAVGTAFGQPLLFDNAGDANGGVQCTYDGVASGRVVTVAVIPQTRQDFDSNPEVTGGRRIAGLGERASYYDFQLLVYRDPVQVVISDWTLPQTPTAAQRAASIPRTAAVARYVLTRLPK